MRTTCLAALVVVAGACGDDPIHHLGDAPDGSDPYFDHVVLLMHFDGADGSTSFVDVKGHAITPVGGTTLSATTAPQGTSGHFGPGAYLTAATSDDWNFDAGDFTVELFAYFDGSIASQLALPTFFSYWGPTSLNQSWQLCYDVSWSTAQGSNNLSPGTLFTIFSTTGSDEVIPAVPWAPAASTWYHLAAVRHGADFLYFANGALVGSQTLGTAQVPDWTRTDPASNTGVWNATGTVAADVAIHVNTQAPLGIGAGIGAPGSPNPASFITGYLDEARITKGIARYTTAFTPPTLPFPDR